MKRRRGSNLVDVAKPVVLHRTVAEIVREAALRREVCAVFLLLAA